MTLKVVLDAIEKNERIVFHQDIYAFLKISRSSYYRHFPSESDEWKVIDEALENNKTNMKLVIRDRLAESKSPAALLSLYRLIATREERDALNSYRMEEIEAKENSKTIQLKID